MAQGDTKLFEEFVHEVGDGVHKFSTDTFKLMLVSDTTIAASLLTPRKADFTECTAGGNYVAGGASLTVTWLEAAGVGTFDFTNTVQWLKAAGSPTDVRWGVVYNDTHVDDRAVGFIDLRTGAGPDPISLVDADLTIDAHANGLFTHTLTN